MIDAKRKEETLIKKYIVKPEHHDSFYGRCDEEYIKECQTNGIPQEDINFMIEEYGHEIMGLLEEI